LRHVHGHGRIAEVLSAVALDARAVNRWTDLGAADGERLGTLLRPPVSTRGDRKPGFDHAAAP